MFSCPDKRVKQATRDFTQFHMPFRRWTNGPIKRSCGQMYWQALWKCLMILPPCNCRRMRRWCTTPCTSWRSQCNSRSRSRSALCSVTATSRGASGGVSSASSKRYKAIGAINDSTYDPWNLLCGHLVLINHKHFFCKSLIVVIVFLLWSSWFWSQLHNYNAL